MPGYLEEADIAPDSSTETFVALKVEIDTWRWAGVPFYLRTGKRLQDRVTELVVTFDEVPHPIFETPSTTHTANELVIRLQPDESITLTILAKNPGEGMRLEARQPGARSGRDLQNPQSRCLRAAAHGHGEGESDLVHAQRRTRRRLGMDRPDPRRLATI